MLHNTDCIMAKEGNVVFCKKQKHCQAGGQMNPHTKVARDNLGVPDTSDAEHSLGYSASLCSCILVVLVIVILMIQKTTLV